MSTAVAEERMTAAEFVRKYGHCSGVELVRGRVVWAGREEGAPAGAVRMPTFKHGVVCQRVAKAIADHVEAGQLGWVAINDTFVTVDPAANTVRGPDVLYISYVRLPPGPLPDDLPVAPDLVVEVRSPSDRWSDVFAKVSDYLAAGVTAVLVLDPERNTASVYRDDNGQQIFTAADELTLPDVLPGFAVPVRRFFE